MALVQSHFRGRDDSQALNSESFDYGVDGNWTQVADRAFRIRFEVEETSGSSDSVGGVLEASLNGGTFQGVTTTSGTVVAAPSERFDGGDLTTDVINASTRAFVSGAGAVVGTAGAISLADEQTELEYAVRLVGSDLTSGGTVQFRVADLDTYAQTPSLIVSVFTDRDRVRLAIGDTDDADFLLTNAEIDRYVAAWPNNVALAAANAAEAIAAKFARDFNFSEDGQTFNRRERVLHYMELAKSLRRGGHLVWPTG